MTVFAIFFTLANIADISFCSKGDDFKPICYYTPYLGLQPSAPALMRIRQESQGEDGGEKPEYHNTPNNILSGMFCMGGVSSVGASILMTIIEL